MQVAHLLVVGCSAVHDVDEVPPVVDLLEKHYDRAHEHDPQHASLQPARAGGAETADEQHDECEQEQMLQAFEKSELPVVRGADERLQGGDTREVARHQARRDGHRDGDVHDQLLSLRQWRDHRAGCITC